MIDRDDPLPVVGRARLLGMSRSAVYYLPRPLRGADPALTPRLDALHLDHPFMGSRQLCRHLVGEDWRLGRLHVRTLMRKMGLHALAPQSGTSQRHSGRKAFPYLLLRKLTIARSNQVWALDTTYIPIARGFVYLLRAGSFGYPDFGVGRRTATAWQRYPLRVARDPCAENPRTAVGQDRSFASPPKSSLL